MISEASNRIVVVEAGGTKTTCSLIVNNKVVSTRVNGPFFVSNRSSWDDFVAQLPEPMEALYFFGTGCVGGIQEAFKAYLIQKCPISMEISVLSDLDAVAVAALGGRSGNVHIMGTGSAFNVWNGEAMLDPCVNLGYIWEDYFSGFYFGKRLISLWKRKQLTEHDESYLNHRYGDLRNVVDQIYRSNEKKTFVANFALDLEHLENTTRQGLVEDGLKAYMRAHEIYFQDNAPHVFNGSVAYSFKNDIRRVFENKGYYVETFIKEAQAGLLDFYCKK